MKPETTPEIQQLRAAWKLKTVAFAVPGEPEDLVTALEGLPERERYVVERRMGFQVAGAEDRPSPARLRDLSEELDTSMERVVQLNKKGLRLVRQRVEELGEKRRQELMYPDSSSNSGD